MSWSAVTPLPRLIQKTPSLLSGLSKQGMFQHTSSRGLISFANTVSVFISFFSERLGSMHGDRQLGSLKRCTLQIQRAVALVRTYDTAFGGAGCWSRDPDSKEEEWWWSFPPFLRPPVMKRSLTHIKRKDSKACASVASASKCLRNMLASTIKVLIFNFV